MSQTTTVRGDVGVGRDVRIEAESRKGERCRRLGDYLAFRSIIVPAVVPAEQVSGFMREYAALFERSQP